MKKLTFVVDERELSTIRAALFLLQEQVDALPEDLAEMVTRNGQPMTATEIEQLSLRLDEQESPMRDYAALKHPQANMAFEANRTPSAPIA
jgi:hypothetical protein